MSSVYVHPLVRQNDPFPSSPIRPTRRILYAKRWPIDRTSSDTKADTFFEALAHLAVDWLDRETPMWLPTTTTRP
ncbi:hypothetical protein [Pseudofrankia sp. BMG5.36]|uniref:hypothetical protein n=1 Tax=Pseudofrankia sp. BMG5.36 TaxID=1834512 RepID=UPI0008D93EDD|nr:hypothetical protein [Pseudofrankia sp. BMG5.36]OHV59560.1 hypothetical protein BCD48_41185 [Pseudofrankia sp. BMG5.36]